MFRISLKGRKWSRTCVFIIARVTADGAGIIEAEQPLVHKNSCTTCSRKWLQMQLKICLPRKAFEGLTLEKTNMFHYMQKAWNQCGISVESWKFHINTMLWKFQVPHYLCRDRISIVELECNLYGTESHSILLWKKCGIIVELTFRLINSTLWNSFGLSLSGVHGWNTVELLWKLSMFHIVSIQWNLLDRPHCKIRNMICSVYKETKIYH